MENSKNQFLKDNIYTDSYKQNFNMDGYYQMLENNVEYIRQRVSFKPDILVTLGSGLQGLAEKIDQIGSVSYIELTDFPFSTVKSHDGRFIFGNFCGKKIICMKGRIHNYEGYDMHDCVAPIRLAHMLGAKTAIITNAVGAINENFKVGEFMAVRDAITHFMVSPLRGPNIYELGHRFIDTTYMYDKGLIDLALDVARKEGINLHTGVNIQSRGPHFETPADIKMFKIAGADTVGMSSVNEAIAARHMNMKCLNINFISNMAAGILDQPLSDEEVQKTAFESSKIFEKLILGILQNLPASYYSSNTSK